jgi:hypothetical protein
MAETASEQDAALTEWLALSEALLRGLVHALNNRLTAISAFVELAVAGDEEFAVQRVLPAELARLQDVGGLFRLLVGNEGAPEAMELGPVLEDALALHVQNPTLRGVRCAVVRAGASPTVRVPRWALLRLLLVMLESGKRAAEAAKRETTTLRVESDEAWVTLRIEGSALSPYGAVMACLCGAAPDTQAGADSVRIPTLLEVRRRERLGREGAVR